jgi:transposase
MDERRTRLMYEVNRLHGVGESMRAIARILHIDRRTARRILNEVEQRRDQGDDALAQLELQRRVPRPSKLDRHRDFIAEVLGRYPDIRATRLHEELVAVGFDGGYTIVRQYLKEVRPKPKKRTAHLVETEPGKQAQADWSPYTLADGTPLYCFSCVLSYSRYLYAEFCTDMRQTTVFRQLRAAFEAFGGVPHEIVFDSMPGIVDRWELDQPVLNLHAVDFAVYYDTGLHIAPRADGAYKGKVERPFRYIEESLLNARTLHTVQQARDTMAWWLEHKANPRTHSRLKRRPIDMLDEERPYLKALPSNLLRLCRLRRQPLPCIGGSRFLGIRPRQRCRG